MGTPTPRPATCSQTQLCTRKRAPRRPQAERVTRSPGLLKSRRGHELARATCWHCSLQAAPSQSRALSWAENPLVTVPRPLRKAFTRMCATRHTRPHEARHCSVSRVTDARLGGPSPKVRRRAAPCPRLRALCCGSGPPHRCSASRPPAGDGTPRARLGSARPSADSAGSQLLEHSTSTALPARISVFRLNANAGINLIEPLSQRPSGNRLCTSTATACSGSAAPQPASPATELLADHAGMAVRLW